MQIGTGKPLPLGATAEKDRINFSVAVPSGKKCELLLYKKGRKKPACTFPLREEDAVGEVRFLSVEGIDAAQYEYNYAIEGKVTADPYARSLTGRKTWNRPGDVHNHEVRCACGGDGYDWEGDRTLKLPFREVVAYSLHVRGFTRHTSSGVKHKGTFLGVIEKIPYLKELGINQIHCMPVYEFEECGKVVNYWGYGPGFYFAPKSSYASDGDGARELKDMVKACHRARIEVVLEMPFTGDVSKQMIEECLRYYMMEYHVDGFILNPYTAPMESIAADPILKTTKIFTHQTDFQNVMRRFLKGDEGMVGDVICHLRRRAGEGGAYNYIANQNGFTLNDLVSYDGKHNESNGEHNQDGPDYNFSWNCGAEGPSRKRQVTALRESQIRNAFLLVLLAQGIPCILAGDEFRNTQKGNNNAYCQDNPLGWLDWSRLERDRGLYEFVRGLIAFRKAHPVFSQENELRGMDRMGCGVPDVSYHGENAWRTPCEISSRQLGVYYCGKPAEDDDCFVAYNMHWMEHSFALPALPKGKKWYEAVTTEDGVMEEARLLENQRAITLKERTVSVLVGR